MIKNFNIFMAKARSKSTKKAAGGARRKKSTTTPKKAHAPAVTGTASRSTKKASHKEVTQAAEQHDTGATQTSPEVTAKSPAKRHRKTATKKTKTPRKTKKAGGAKRTKKAKSKKSKKAKKHAKK